MYPLQSGDFSKVQSDESPGIVNTGVGDRSYFEKSYLDRDWRFYRPILCQLIAHSEPGSILDVGAGTGFLVEAGLRWGLDCVGIEGSPEAIEIGRQRFPNLPLRCHLLSEPFPFKDESFQTVVMNQVIEHLEADVARHAVKESARVLRSGGMLMINSPSRFNKFEKVDDPTHINMYSPTELRNLVASAGFRDIVATNYPLDLLGQNFFSRKIMSLLFLLTRWDRLSATANCRGYKRA